MFATVERTRVRVKSTAAKDFHQRVVDLAPSAKRGGLALLGAEGFLSIVRLALLAHRIDRCGTRQKPTA